MLIQSTTQIKSTAAYPRYILIFDILVENWVYYLTRKKNILEAFTITGVLTMTHLVVARFVRWVFAVETKIPTELLSLTEGRHVIVANHQSALDSYIILATLPFRTFSQLLPVRFFTANVYLRHWWQRAFLFSFGCFRAYSTDSKLSGVKGGLQLSDAGQTLFIFPEGKRNREGTPIKPKIGIGYLVQKRNFTILPVYINLRNHKRKSKTEVTWGKPFVVSPKERAKDLQTLTNQIFDRVLALSHHGDGHKP